MPFLVCFFVCLVAQLCPTLCGPMDCRPSGSSARRIFSGKNTGVGCHALLQEIFPTQRSKPGHLHCRQILYHQIHQGSPLAGKFFTTSATWEALKKKKKKKQLKKTLYECDLGGKVLHYHLTQVIQDNLHWRRTLQM